MLGYAAYTFALGGLAFWMPTFLERVRGIPAVQASAGFGEIVVVTGFVGTFAGGWLGDYWLRYSKQAYLLMSGWITLLAVPAVYLALAAGTPCVFYPALIVAELLLFMSTGPDQHRHRQSRQSGGARIGGGAQHSRHPSARRCPLAVHHRGAVGRILARGRGDDRARRRRRVHH